MNAVNPYSVILILLFSLSGICHAQDVDTLWEDTQAYIDAAEWDDALDSAHEALQLARKGSRDSLAIDIRLAMGVIYYNIGELDAAVRETRNAALEIHDDDNVVQRLKAYTQLGVFFQTKGMFRGSSEYFKRASELALGVNDLNKVAEIYYNMGENASRSSRFDEALEFSYKSADLYRELNNESRLALVYNNLSTIYRKLSRYDQAIDFLTKAQVINMNSQNWAQVADNYYNLGQIYIDRRHASTARQYFNRAIRIFQETDNYAGLIRCELALANLECDNDQLSDAELHVQNALNQAKEHNELSLMPHAYLTYGRIQQRHQQPVDAINSLEMAMAAAKAISANEELLNIYLTLSKVYEKEGAYNQSLSYFKTYDSLKDSLHNEIAQQKIAEMQTVYEYFEQEKEIDQLQNRLIVEQVSREKERLEHESDLAIQQIRSETERNELQNELRLEQITSEQRKLLLENEQMTSRQQRLELQNAEIRTRHQRLQLVLSFAGLVTLAAFAFFVAHRYRQERQLRNKIDSQKRELEAAYLQLKEAQRQKIELEQLRSVMAMSVTMNHELNQPLMIIQGNLEMLEHAIDSGMPISKYVNHIQMSVERISLLLEKIRGMEDVRFQHYGGGSDMIHLREHESDEYEKGADLNDDDLNRIGKILNK